MECVAVLKCRNWCSAEETSNIWGSNCVKYKSLSKCKYKYIFILFLIYLLSQLFAILGMIVWLNVASANTNSKSIPLYHKQDKLVIKLRINEWNNNCMVLLDNMSVQSSMINRWCSIETNPVKINITFLTSELYFFMNFMICFGVQWICRRFDLSTERKRERARESDLRFEG